MRIYISGSMASCMDTYRKKFAKAQRMLEADGHIVINPAVLSVGLDSDKYMPICLSMIDAADAICMIGSDWHLSKGAMLEKAYAEYQEKAVVFLENCDIIKS